MSKVSSVVASVIQQSRQRVPQTKSATTHTRHECSGSTRLPVQSTRPHHTSALVFALASWITYSLPCWCTSVSMSTWLTLYILQPVTGLPGRQPLRSSSTSALIVPLTRLSAISDRAFPVAAARTWRTVCHQKWRHQAVSDHSRLNSKPICFPPLSQRWL